MKRLSSNPFVHGFFKLNQNNSLLHALKFLIQFSTDFIKLKPNKFNNNKKYVFNNLKILYNKRKIGVLKNETSYIRIAPHSHAMSI